MNITLATILKNNEAELIVGEKMLMCDMDNYYMVFENPRDSNGFDKSEEAIDEIFDNPFYFGSNLQEALVELVKPLHEEN